MGNNKITVKNRIDVKELAVNLIPDKNYLKKYFFYFIGNIGKNRIESCHKFTL